MNPESLQNLLWSMLGNSIWWTGYAVVCAIGAAALFVSLLREFDRNALSIGRLLMLSGMIVGVFVRFNSACQPLSAALLASGSAFVSLLIVTDWCHRRGTARQRLGQVWHDLRHKPETGKTLR